MLSRPLYYVLLFLSLLVLSCGTKNNAIYVSPDGDDTNIGTIDKPLQTLQKAKSVVRQMKKGNKGVQVFLRGGTYVLSETIIFDIEDSGTAASPISYEAYEDESVIITSVLPVDGWKKAMNLPDNFPANTYDRIWVADLPQGYELSNYLYQDSRVLPPSRTESFVPYAPSSDWDGATTYRRRVLFPSGLIQSDESVDDIELSIVPPKGGIWYNFPLKYISVTSSSVTTAIPSAYVLGYHKIQAEGENKTASFINCPEGMLKVGNWYINSSERRVYMVSNDEPEDVSIPQLKELIRVEGLVSKTDVPDTPVQHLKFKNITFTGAKRDTWSRRHMRNHIENEWERYDQADALLRFRGAENCEVTNCNFITSGGGGIRLDLHCQDITIANSQFEHLGAYGVFLCGYGVGNKDVNRNNVLSNNYISHVGEAYKHSAAITIFQSGDNHIVNNTIEHTPYHSIVITGLKEFHAASLASGKTALINVSDSASYDWNLRSQFLHSRNNLLENNDISYSVESMNDGHAIYMSACGENNIIRHNYIHDIISPKASSAICADTLARSARIENNLIFNIQKSAITFNDINHANDNIIIDASFAKNTGFLVFRGGLIDGSCVSNNLFVKTGFGVGRYIVKRSSDKFPFIDLNKAFIRNNVFYQKGLSEEEKSAGVYEIKTKAREVKVTNYPHSASQIKYAEITGVKVKDDKPFIDIYAPIFKQGHKPFDLSIVGVQDQSSLKFPAKTILTKNLD